MNRKEFIVTSTLAVLAGTLVGCHRTRNYKFTKNQVIGCFGDSITAAKNGYVSMLRESYAKSEPEMGLRFLNYGKSSETVTGLTEEIHPGPRPYLFERLDNELDKEPIDVALFCYGINCGVYGEPSQKLFDGFKTGVYTFLEKMHQREIGTILLTPPPLALEAQIVDDTADIDHYGYLNPYPEYDEEVLQIFKEIILQIDHPSVLKKIDIHTPLLQRQMSCYDEDPIHPNVTGHRLIADAIIKKLSV